MYQHDYLSNNPQLKKNQTKTILVILLTFVTMVVEITFGYFTSSMALLADGWHMASHVVALALTLCAYLLAKNKRFQKKMSFGGGKVLSLGGYSNAIILAIFSIIIVYESTLRLISPVPIQFDQAILVAVIGLIVNVVSALILVGGDHDHNIKGAYYHVLADGLTSFLAIFALLAGKFYNLTPLDPMMGLVGGVVICKWAITLAKNSAKELLDFTPLEYSPEDIKNEIKKMGASEIIDFHLWQIAPKSLCLSCILINEEPISTQQYREHLQKKFPLLVHQTIEVVR